MNLTTQGIVISNFKEYVTHFFNKILQVVLKKKLQVLGEGE